MTKTILLILLAEVWSTIGQILFKKSTNEMAPRGLRGLGGHADFLKEVMAKPLVWLGLGAQALGIVTWLAALAGADLSVASPVGSMQYILILVAAHLFLGEKISWPKLIGTLLVVLGIVLVAVS